MLYHTPSSAAAAAAEGALLALGRLLWSSSAASFTPSFGAEGRCSCTAASPRRCFTSSAFRMRRTAYQCCPWERPKNFARTHTHTDKQTEKVNKEKNDGQP